ncbi:MAG TPA: fatty acid desaturase [Candidatus Xenobia bacterium]
MLKFVCWLVVWHTLLCLGITIGYHRLLTHRSFQCPRWIEYAWVTLGWAALMGPPISWVAVHRFHHANSDEVEDPHSPVHKGWWWSQVGWIAARAQERKLWMAGALADRAHDWPNSYDNDTPFMQKYAKDIHLNPYYRRLDFVNSLIFLAITAGLMFLVGGWPAMLGRLVAALTTMWVTWYVNSYAHTDGFGYRNFETRDASRNVWWVALLTQGEGWHNNHHHRPLSARHGMRWWEFDLSWCVIRTMQALGLARKVYAYTYEQALDRKEVRTAA